MNRRFFSSFFDPARVDHAPPPPASPPGHYKIPAFNGIQATIRGFTVFIFVKLIDGRKE